MRGLACMALACSCGCALGEQSIACLEGGNAVELFGDPTCDVCVAESCCAQASACAQDPGCLGVTECFRTCSDEACFQACRAAHPHDEALLGALVDCAGRSCEKDHGCVLPERSVACVDAGAVADLFGIASCDLCVRRNACDEAAACAANEGCRARAACMTQCTGGSLNPACFDVCRDDGLVGVGDGLLFQAVAKNCREACGIGATFECIEAYSWPHTPLPTVNVELRATNRLTGTGFDGLAITPCSNLPGACTSAGPVSNTNTEGVALLTVPTNNPFDPIDEMVFSGFRGYWSFEDPSGGDWVTTLLYRTRPEYRHRAADDPAPFGSRSLMQLAFGQVANVDPQDPAIVDPARGAVFGAIFDCRGNIDFFAHGIVVSVDGTDASFRLGYVNDEQVGIEHGLTATATSGQFGMINLTPGTHTFNFDLEADGRSVASLDASVEAGHVTVLGIWPNAKQ